LAAVLAAALLLAALSASADAARRATPLRSGLPASLVNSRSAASRLTALRIRRDEQTAMRRREGAAASPSRAARPDLTASGFEGTVTDASSKDAVTGVEVCAFNIKALEEGLYREELEPVCETVTEPNGHYEVRVPPGEYFVEFLDPSRNYIIQIYNGKTLVEEPDRVVVKAKPLTKDINAALVKGGRIEGQVTAAAGGRPLSGIRVCAFAVHADGFGCEEETGSEGRYQIRGLPSGSYEVSFEVPPFPGYNYLDGQLEEVGVTAGATTTGANVSLQSGGEIEGKVTTAAGGAALEKVWVCAFPTVPVTEEELEELERCTRTAGDGTYTIERLEPGSYYVEFFDESGYSTQFYNGTAYGAPHLAGALALNVVPPTPVTGINGAMLRVGEEPPKPPPALTPSAPQNTSPPPPAPVPAVAVLSTKVVVPALTAEGRVRVSGRRGTVKLRCRVGPCKGTIQLTITVARRVRSHGHTVTRRLTLVVGSGSFSLVQGASATATIRLTSQGARLLASAARHPQAGKLKLVLHGAKTTQRGVVVR
jgi:hypothetical protein